MNQHTYLSWNIVSWSIGAEWWAYIFGIGLLYYVANNKKHSVIIAAVSFFCLTCLVYFHQKNNLDITFDFGFLRCFFEFSLGVTSYQVFKLNLAKNIFQQDKTFIITLLALLAIFHLRLNDLLAIPLFFTLVLCAAFNRQVILCLLSKPIPQYLGRISYSIYLMHGVWFMVFWFVLPILKDAWLIKSLSITQTGFYIVTFMTLTLISAIYSHRYIELPFRYLPIQKNIKLLLTADK
jgi:peptidoglycan/LPS O-acetylase OafA/YrhL